MKLLLTPRQRFDLAQLFYAVPIEGDVLAWTKTFNRSRLALGLTPIMDVLTAARPVDPKTLEGGPAVFSLEGASVDFLLGKVFAQIKQAYQVVLFSSVMEALETYQLTKEQPLGQEGSPYDPSAESWALPEDAVDKRIKDLVELAKTKEVSPKDLLSKVHTAIEAIAVKKP